MRNARKQIEKRTGPMVPLKESTTANHRLAQDQGYERNRRTLRRANIAHNTEVTKDLRALVPEGGHGLESFRLCPTTIKSPRHVAERSGAYWQKLHVQFMIGAGSQYAVPAYLHKSAKIDDAERPSTMR